MRIRIPVALLLLLLCAHAAFAGCVPLWTVPRSSTWSSNGPIEGGDFNGDGLTDLVTIWNNNVSLQMMSTAALPPPVLVYTGSYLANRIVVRDVQGDGMLDLLVGDLASNTVIFLAGHGDGTFATPVVTPVAISPTFLLAGDFTGDGILDVAFRSFSAETIAVRSGDGTGAFDEELARTPLADPNVDALEAADLDGDALDDVIVTRFGSTRVDVFYSNGDGTFDAPLQLTGGDSGAAIATADLDDDGDVDFVIADWTSDTMTAFRNDGNRTFGITSYNAAFSDSLNNPLDLDVADVTQDGILDVVLIEPNSRQIVTFEGLGAATFGEATYAYALRQTGAIYLPVGVVAGQFDDDGRTDIAVIDRNNVSLYANNCGEVDVWTAVEHPIISVGQETRFDGWVRRPNDFIGSANGYGAPTGSVTVFAGATELGTYPLTDASFSAVISGLPAGEHALRAEYSGDEHYHVAESDPVTLTVTTMVTTVTISPQVAGPYVYGGDFAIAGNATSTGGTPTGNFGLRINGEPAGTSSGPPFSFDAPLYSSGTMRYQVEYPGSDSFPPGLSNELVIEVAKDKSELMASYPFENVSNVGATQLHYQIQPEHWWAPFSGTVSLLEGDAVLDSVTIYNTRYIEFQPSLPPGRHALRLVYSGDENVLPATLDFVHDVVPAALRLDANADAAAQSVTLSWQHPSSFSRYSVKRRVGSGWVELANVFGSSYVHSGLQPGTAYVYRVDALNSNLQIMATSNSALGMIVPFTDDPLTPGTRVKAQHVRELVNATNALRAEAGLPAHALTVAAGTPVRAADLTALRAALDQALSTLALPAMTWNAPAPATNAPVRARHLHEMRAAFR